MNYFHSAYPVPIAVPVMRPDSLPRFWHYINPLLTYLPTYTVRHFLARPDVLADPVQHEKVGM